MNDQYTFGQDGELTDSAFPADDPAEIARLIVDGEMEVADYPRCVHALATALLAYHDPDRDDRSGDGDLDIMWEATVRYRAVLPAWHARKMFGLGGVPSMDLPLRIIGLATGAAGVLEPLDEIASYEGTFFRKLRTINGTPVEDF